MEYYYDGKLKNKAYYYADGSSSWIAYKYHSLGYLTEVDYPDGSYVKYDLDSLGRVFACQKFDSGNIGQGEYSFNYDAFDKIIGVQYPDNAIYGNSRRGDGQIDYQRITYDETSDPNGVYRTFADYDWAGRQTTGFNSSGMDGWYAWLGYDRNSNLEQLYYMNGFSLNGETAVTYGYNKDNQLNSITGSYYNLSGVTIDGLGRLKIGTETISPASGSDIVNNLNFDYNRRGSLTSANIGSWAGSYGYKLDGNLETRTEAGLTEPFEYDFDNNGTDESNMLSEIAGNPISWDKNGRLTSDGMHSFVYDYDGKMQVATSISDPDITVTYNYDPMGNRVGRIETNASGVVVSEKKFILDYTGKVPKILLEMTKVSGNWVVSQKNYYYGNMLVMSTDGSNTNRRYYIHDRLGSVRVVTNRNVSVLNNYTYTPYGEDIVSQTAETVVNNVRYAGYNFDHELTQYYVWARMYSPYMARFNGYDPVLGDYQEPLTLHQYLYCLNDPINMYDPDGRFAMMDNVTAMGRYAQMASNGYDVASGVMDFARKVAGGASLSNVVLGLAIDAASNKIGGKGLDFLTGAGSKAINKLKGRMKSLISGDERVQLYRVISQNEFDDIGKNGLRWIDGNESATGAPGKFFWDNMDSADEWAEFLQRHQEDASHVISTFVDKGSIATKKWHSKAAGADGWAYFVEMQNLMGEIFIER
jgi:RHS repeat-associated protein